MALNVDYLFVSAAHTPAQSANIAECGDFGDRSQ
jgi:hypothetical protein